MFLEKWFSLPIWYVDIDINLEPIKQKCLELKSASPGRQYSNRGGWQSNDFFFTDYPELTELTQRLTEELDSACRDVNENFKLEINNVWINVNENGNSNARHVHALSVLSGVFYVAATEQSGNIVFEHETGIEHYSVNHYGSDLFNGTVRYAPIAGRLLIFPSWLHHYVEPVQDNNTRISIAFNTKQIV
jgi:uncharacterized protein (TIGR02466 family)